VNGRNPAGLCLSGQAVKRCLTKKNFFRSRFSVLGGKGRPEQLPEAPLAEPYAGVNRRAFRSHWYLRHSRDTSSLSSKEPGTKATPNMLERSFRAQQMSDAIWAWFMGRGHGHREEIMRRRSQGTRKLAMRTKLPQLKHGAQQLECSHHF
jgi:hypothetical protein